MKIYRALLFSLVLATITTFFAGCTRDPNVRKHKYFARGQDYVQDDRLDAAAIEFRNAIGIDPAYAEAHYQLALVYLRTRQWPSASQELARVIDLQPENFKARAEFAKLLIAAGSLVPAQEQVDWLAKNYPTDANSHSLAADLMAAQGNFPSALQEAEKAVALDPTSAELERKLALVELRNGQAQTAEASFKKAIELDPRAVAPRLMLANFYQVHNRSLEAEAQLRIAVSANQQDPEPVAALARFYLEQNKRPEAEELLIRSKYGFADNSAGYRLLGDFYLGLGELDKAANEYRALNEEHPEDLEVKKNFVDLLIRTNQLGKAKVVDDEILKADPSDSDGLIFRGECQLQAGDITGAVGIFQTVIRNDPGNGLAHYQLGVAFQKSGSLETAESEWRQAVHYRPDLVDAQRELAQLAIRRGDMATLDEASGALIKLRPASADGYAMRAVVEISQKHFSAAESDARKAVELAPSSAAGYVQIGNLNFAEAHFADAESSYRLALDRDPKSNDALRGLMNSYVARGQVDAAVSAVNDQIGKVQDSSEFYDLLGTVLFERKKDLTGAAAAFSRSIELDKNNADAIIKLVQVQVASGQIERAIATYEQASKDNPRNADFYVMVGDIFRARRDWAHAKEAYQKALAIRYDDPVASGNLAYVMLETGGDLERALSLAQAARKRTPNSPEVADTLGWIYYQKGIYRSAVQSLEAALQLALGEKDANTARFRYHLGMAYAKAGDTVRAREQLHRMLKMNPDSNEAFDAKKELSQLQS